nr:hypothetical protein [Acutalibacter muris]
MLQKRKGFDHTAAALGTVLFGPSGCGLGALADTQKKDGSILAYSLSSYKSSSISTKNKGSKNKK